jgi:ribosome-associated protein
VDDTPDFDDLPSKSQRKRDMDALQDIGAELTELNAQQLDSIELPESLREAVLEARAMKHN